MRRAAAVAMFLIFVMKVMASAPTVDDSTAQARQVLMKCIDSVGDLNRLQNVKVLSYQSLSHTFLHSVSMSDSLPALFAYETNEVVLQTQRRIVKDASHWQWTESATPSISEFVTSPEGGFIERNSKRTPVTADKFYEAVDMLAANPISALLSASNAADLKLLQPSHKVYEISFLQTVYGQRVKTTLGIDKRSYALQWIEIQHSYSQDVYSSMWGDTAKRFVYSSWFLDASGLYFPTKWKVSTNGEEDGQVSLLDVKINRDSPVTSDIPDEFKDSFGTFLHISAEDLAKRNLGNGDHLEVQDGIVMLPGKERAYNSLIVKQDKGILIVEAPYSIANSEQVVAYIHSAFPNIPILGIVSSDFYWFHIAGLPTYAKARIPIYVLDANVGRVRRLLSSQVPESGVQGSVPLLRTVQGRTEMGTGMNRMILLPFRGVASAKMMAVYFPERKLLYCSDLYLPVAWAHQYWAEHLSEILDLIEREHIDVQQITGVSAPPHDWKELSASIPSRAADRVNPQP
jgi:hypothetical protein